MPIPPLAGICTYAVAAKPGFGVDETVARLLRYAWIEKRIMEAGLYWMNPIPEWEVKAALSYHLYLAAEHVKLIRDRISEMRNPPPRMDISPSAALDAFLNELLMGEDTLERVVGLYGVLKPALLATYQEHKTLGNPLIDAPTMRILKTMIAEEEESLEWGYAAIAALTTTEDSAARAEAWSQHLRAYLHAAGGIAGNAPTNGTGVPAPRANGHYEPDFFPQRDDRFPQTGNFVFPPHAISRLERAPIEEKNLALMCKRALEMDVPEAMAGMIARAENEPWDYYVDMCRQLWDEARHAMMGEIYFEHHGVTDWREKIAIHVGFSMTLNNGLTPIEAHAILYMIEQGLMPAATGKKYEWNVSKEAHDPLATLFQDYDWADEVLHTQIGRRWLVPKFSGGREEVIGLAEQKREAYAAYLLSHSDPAQQVDWWPAFVRQVLNREATPVDEPEVTLSE